MLHSLLDDSESSTLLRTVATAQRPLPLLTDHVYYSLLTDPVYYARTFAPLTSHVTSRSRNV